MIAIEPGFPDRNFAAGAPNRCWVADITYLRTSEGWLYLVAVQDLYSRRIDALLRCKRGEPATYSLLPVRG